MSTKYTGGFITKSPVAPTTTAASGIWTLDQQQQAQKAGTWPSPPIFIEDLFSTYLYAGTGAAQTITNGVDLSGKGGLTWIKIRDAADSHILTDTVRGVNSQLRTNLANAAQSEANRVTSFTSSGFVLGVNTDVNQGGASPVRNYVSWTFAEQPKFFDVVTYTGDGTNNRAIPHNLGSTPGFIIVKTVSTAQSWICYHTALGTGNYLSLNSTAASAADANAFPAVSSTTFTPTANDSLFSLNTSSVTFVAYLFAHNAGGFPVSGGGSTNGISCGSFSTDGSGNATVSLGYEPQWLMYKCSSSVGDWEMVDVMRGWVVGVNNDNGLRANSSDAESAGSNRGEPSSTGFNCVSFPTNRDFIYIAIRRGPMKPPTTGTSVYNAIARTGTGATANVTGVGFPVDLNWSHIRDAAYPNVMDDRLRGSSNTLKPSTTDGEASSSTVTSFASMDGVQYGTSDRTNASGNTYINWYFRRAPGFFDEVCYTGTGTPTNFTHNLGVVPEMMIVKRRDATSIWAVYAAPLATAATSYLELSEDTAVATGNTLLWNSTAPTSTVFTIGASSNINTISSTNIAYLFATLAGVSKVGSYTGTGALQTVNCGFTSGARFVLIKRTDSTGNWYMYDSVRGITSGNDPYLFADVDAVEVTGTNYVDTDTTGFKVTAAAPAGLNANGGTYIFLAIA
jgi:hypothetical protein